MVNAKSVARDLARQRKKPPKRGQHTIGVTGSAYATVRKVARERGLPIKALASAAIFEGVDEAARIMTEEIEAST